MPRFGIKTQITLLSLGLLSIPIMGLSYWDDIRTTALTAQARIQEIEAKAIATSLLATQQNIRKLLAADEDSELQKHALSAPSIKIPIRLDGMFGDWPIQAQIKPRFNLDHPVWLAVPDEPIETAFSLRLAQSSQHLYVAITVRDNQIAFRKPSHLRLDYNDHIQLTYHDESGMLRRVILPAEQEGALASYYTDHEWQFGRDFEASFSYQQKNYVAGQKLVQTIASHKTGIQGYWHRTSDGYTVEFRIPTSQLDTEQPQIHFAIVDVDDNPAYGPQAIVASLPKSLEDKLNPVALHARELQRVIDQLKNTYARLWIYDSRGREWAFAEREPQERINVQLEAIPAAFDSQCVKNALQGKVEPLHHLTGTDGKLKRLLVCYPITEGHETLGVVVIDESADHVLSQEEDRVWMIAGKVGGVIAVLLSVLLIYAFTLVRRISKLSEEAGKSIDLHGRIERTTINASRNFPDEIGDLSRNITTLLEKQSSYMSFLERIPQTLRHEISNPLNKLRTSLENLLDHEPELAKNKYINKIDSGIDQISRITLHLTEAASLESAIQDEQLSRIDLIKFLDGYLSAWNEPLQCNQWDKAPAMILGDSSRLEQLFDKLLDNAISFCPKTGKVQFKVERHADRIMVIIENDGPVLATESSSELFSPMVSTRSSGSSIHLGLGLHIAKLISDQHKASLSGRNREDGSGVIFSVDFELI
jgi:signal transduction histidine kinase